jgi:hypothetical protein
MRDESWLRKCIWGIVAAGAPIAACGSNDPCKSSPCCGNPPSPQTYTVTYTVCPPIDFDASEASSDAGGADADDASDNDAAQVDASDDVAPPPVCYATCDQACAAERPSNMGGAPFCQGTEAGAGDGGTVVAQCELMMLCGRRFDGLSDVVGCGEDFARAAWLEAASIHAFRRLARELRAHGAPDDLVAAARSAAKDEARHARLMARLAKRDGAYVPRVEWEDRGVRDLEALARENAVEACVGETYGALLAEWHARHARDVEVRDVMRAIAPDELRHAALGWAVDAWAKTRLSDDANERVRAARDEAARDLLQNARNREDAPFVSALHAAVWS